MGPTFEQACIGLGRELGMTKRALTMPVVLKPFSSGAHLTTCPFKCQMPLGEGLLCCPSSCSSVMLKGKCTLNAIWGWSKENGVMMHSGQSLPVWGKHPGQGFLGVSMRSSEGAVGSWSSVRQWTLAGSPLFRPLCSNVQWWKTHGIDVYWATQFLT